MTEQEIERICRLFIRLILAEDISHEAISIRAKDEPNKPCKQFPIDRERAEKSYSTEFIDTFVEGKELQDGNYQA